MKRLLLITLLVLSSGPVFAEETEMQIRERCEAGALDHYTQAVKRYDERVEKARAHNHQDFANLIVGQYKEIQRLEEAQLKEVARCIEEAAKEVERARLEPIRQNELELENHERLRIEEKIKKDEAARMAEQKKHDEIGLKEKQQAETRRMKQRAAEEARQAEEEAKQEAELEAKLKSYQKDLRGRYSKEITVNPRIGISAKPGTKLCLYPAPGNSFLLVEERTPNKTYIVTMYFLSRGAGYLPFPETVEMALRKHPRYPDAIEAEIIPKTVSAMDNLERTALALCQ